VCPHCGARRKNPPKLELDANEVRALLVAKGAVDANHDERDWLATLVMPHPSTYGTARALELLLTLAALPFVLAGVVFFALHRLRKRGPIKMRGEVGPLLLMSLMGTLGLWMVLAFGGVPFATTIKLAAGFIAALSVRAAIRAKSAPALLR
jgi:hypothetical protein